MFTIADLEAASGINRRNIHFYVQQGLVPPPDGAGLGARYDDEHLLRLRAIPVMRNRGLRLDEIREKLASTTVDDLRRLLAEPQPLPGPVDRIPSQSVTGRTTVRYEVAPGVEIFVDAGADASLRDKVRTLIEQAQLLFHNDREKK